MVSLGLLLLTSLGTLGVKAVSVPLTPGPSWLFGLFVHGGRFPDSRLLLFCHPSLSKLLKMVDSDTCWHGRICGRVDAAASLYRGHVQAFAVLSQATTDVVNPLLWSSGVRDSPAHGHGRAILKTTV